MAVYLNNVALFTFVLFASSFSAEKIVTVKVTDSGRKNSEWLRKYLRVTATVCSSQSSSYKIIYFSASHNDFIIDLIKDILTVTSSNAYVHINQDRGDSISEFTNEIGVYKGFVRQPCCGHVATIKLTSEGLDATIHTSNTTYVLEPESRWELSGFPKIKTANINSTCENFSCILYEPSDMLQNITSTAINDIFYLNDIDSPEREQNPIKDRDKRSISAKTECTLNLVADYYYFEKEGNSKISDTIAAMIYIISESNLHYRKTDFDGDGKPDGYGFYVANITVYTKFSGYKMLTKTHDGLGFLEEFALYNHDNYCLGLCFTSQWFKYGIKGLAYSNAACKRRNRSGISYNTAVVTIETEGKMNYGDVGKTIHEIGHSFGAPHDPKWGSDLCSPGGDVGNYVMFPRVQDGSLPNNQKFSSCSIERMYPVIRWVRDDCFEPLKPVCGNGIREEGEECDCGTSHTCMAIDPCCTPSDVNVDVNYIPCTLNKFRGRAECSPKISACCTDTCQIVANNSSVKCGNVQECTVQAYCDGISADCPSETFFKPDNSLCDEGRKTCSGGRCVKSICSIDNLLPCTCPEPHECYECCMSNSSECLRAWSDSHGHLLLPFGVSCGNRQGFCDKNGQCIMGDQVATFERLDHIFTEVGIHDAKNWFSDYWYYVVTCIVVLSLLVTIFVTSCRGEKDVKGDAYAHAQFLRVAREAEIQKHHLEKRREEMEAFYRGKIDEVEKENMSVKMNLTKASVRMITFFPTAPRDLLLHSMRVSANEDNAVKMMLSKNYPFRRFRHFIKK